MAPAIKSRLVSAGALALVLAAATVLSLRYMPPTWIGADSGGFLYGGWQLLEGKLPYVDFWDHKPPATFLLNAAGLSLGAGAWGVWLVETVLFAGSLGLFSMAIARKFGPCASAIGVVVLLFSARNGFFFQGGNFSEGYSLCFSTAILAGLLFQPRHWFAWFLMGVAGGIIGFTKQSCTAVPLAAAVTLLGAAFAGKTSEAKRYCIAFLSGGLSVVVVAILAMASLGILHEFWDTNFVFSRIYIAEAAHGLDLLHRFNHQISAYGERGVFNVSVFVFIGTMLRMFLRRRANDSPVGMLVEPTVLLALIIEFWFISMPYRFYGHYFLGLFPLLATGFALWYDTLVGFVSELKPASRVRNVGAVGLGTLMAFLMFSGPLSIFGYPGILLYAVTARGAPEDQEVLQYLTTADPSSPLLMWGHETKWNFISRRASPSRYSFIAPLVRPAYQQEARLQELLRDLRAHPDTIIIDSLSRSVNGLGTNESLSDATDQTGNDGPPDPLRPLPRGVIDQLRTYVSREYQVDKVFSNKWVAYTPRRKPS